MHTISDGDVALEKWRQWCCG